jgi:hypothetical protein
MKRAIDQWTMGASFALLLCAFAACKKKSEAPAPTASAVAPPTEIAPLIPTAADAGSVLAAPVLGDVKRYPDKEKSATGAVKVLLDDSKVYDEADDTKPAVASLSKDLFVVRLATLDSGWLLVDFPSGVGKLSPGWIEAKSVGAEAQATVSRVTAAAQPAAKAASTAAPTATVAPPTAPAAATAPSTPVAHKPGAILARPH